MNFPGAAVIGGLLLTNLAVPTKASAAILMDTSSTRTQLKVANKSTDPTIVELTVGDKGVMKIGGTIADLTAQPPHLIYAGEVGGKPSWSSDGTQTAPITLVTNNPGWQLIIAADDTYAQRRWYSGNGTTPDLATGWTGESGSTGTPTFTPLVARAMDLVQFAAGSTYGQNIVRISIAPGADGLNTLTTATASFAPPLAPPSTLA